MGRRKKIVEDLPVMTPREVELKAIGDYSREAFLDFGDYINNHRHMAEVRDGCKISYRRLIYSATQFPKGKLNPTTNLISNVSNYHPHSLDGLLGLNSCLVNSGVFTGEGSFGYIGIDGEENPCAAARYTKTRLSDLYWDVMGDLMKEVPYVESPVGPLEPEYLPIPLPLCLILKESVIGLGVSISSQYPNFSAKSLYKAYINNNPKYLESNVDLILDKKNSELDKLWKTGKGRVIYAYKISNYKGDDGKSEGILFETKDGTGLFTPKINKFKKLVEDGKVFIDDLTDFNSNKLFIGRVPGAKGITVADIEGISRKICYDSTVYQLNVTNGKTAFRIPLYDWLDYTYKNYIDLITQVNKKRIQKCEFDILVQEAIPLVSSYITQKPTASDSELSKNLNIPQEIINVVMTKPISYIRKNKDTSDRIKELKNKLKELKQFNPYKYTEEIINKL